MSKNREPGLNDDERISVERTLNLVRRLIEKIETHLDTTEVKGSLAEYIKILQLQKELDEKRFQRIEVKWVDAD